MDASRSIAPRAADPSGARVFWIAVALTLGVHLVAGGLGPLAVVTRPLVWFASLVHELGHGVAALLVGGEFAELRLWADGSGVATTRVGGGLARAAVSAGGLVGPSLVAALGFVLARGARGARAGLAGFALALALALVFKVRTVFGVVFVAVLVLGCALVALRGSPRARQLVLMFLAVQLAASLWSHLDYMFSGEAATGAGTMPSDSARLGEVLGGPYWLWGGVCALISIAALALGAYAATRRTRAR